MSVRAFECPVMGCKKTGKDIAGIIQHCNSKHHNLGLSPVVLRDIIRDGKKVYPPEGLLKNPLPSSEQYIPQPVSREFRRMLPLAIMLGLILWGVVILGAACAIGAGFCPQSLLQALGKG